ncbi:MAG: hypothetical protein RMH97_06205 [Verrucomicrobiales bacterium]|nr:hypothetical protein [Verrucomicrobiales bacterium]
MAKAGGKRAPAVVLVCGSDEFGVSARAKQIYHDWCEQLGGADHEIIDGAATKTDDALKIIGRLREALFTLPFFGSGKAIWLRDCNFLGAQRLASAASVSEAVTELARELEAFDWASGNVRLVISATEVDRRRVLAKVIEKVGAIETFAGWSLDDKDWSAQAEAWAREQIRASKKNITAEALAELVARVGPDHRLLDSEVQKLILYVGTRGIIGPEDVEAVCIRNKYARAFALADALGARDLRQLLKCLDEELWQMQSDREASEFGLLAGLVTKIRAMLLAKDMVRLGWVNPAEDYESFQRRLGAVPSEQWPQDRRYSPLGLHPYVLFKAMRQASNYTRDELVRAMDMLLQCNQKLLYSDLDARFLLQQTLIDIVSRAVPAAASSA